MHILILFALSCIGFGIAITIMVKEDKPMPIQIIALAFTIIFSGDTLRMMFESCGG